MLPFSENPLSAPDGTPRVEVRRGTDAYGITRAALRALDLGSVRGGRILLKPNAGRVASPGEGVTTNPQVVAAAIDAFVEAGALVTVGESPITGVDTMQALEAAGIAAVARERNCRFVDLDAGPAVGVSHPGGVAMWKDWASPFAPAPAKIDIDFENVRILDCQSCSACQSTVLLFLKKHGDRLADYFAAPVQIAIGKGNSDVPPGTLCIGNCTARHRAKGVFVPGCPPVGSAILKVIEQDAGSKPAG